MSYWADLVRGFITTYLGSGRKIKAAELRVVQGGIADAIEFLEGLQRGAKILSGPAAPDPADGIEGDAYVNTTTSDFYLKDNTGWVLALVLRGNDGKNGKNGTNGRTPVKGVDYFDGANGKSNYQLWQDLGNAGTVEDYLATQKGKDGKDGVIGNKNRWEAFAPTNEAGTVGDAWFYSVSAAKLEIWVCTATNVWAKRFTSPDATVSTGGSSGGVTSFNTRTGAVNLTAADVNAVLTQGDNITLTMQNGKLVIAGAAATSAGHVIKDASGAVITQPTIVVQKGLRVINDPTNSQMSFELDPAGAPATEGNQAGAVVDFAFRYQNRGAGAGNITLSDFQSIGVGGKCRIELNSTGSSDQLIFGGYTVTGADTAFQATVKVSPTAASGTNQVVTFYDVGGPFVGGVKNVLKLECIGTNRFDFQIEPQV